MLLVVLLGMFGLHRVTDLQGQHVVTRLQSQLTQYHKWSQPIKYLLYSQCDVRAGNTSVKWKPSYFTLQ